MRASVATSALFILLVAFCVGCSHFQLELLSLWLFLKILVFNSLVPEISHRKPVIWNTKAIATASNFGETYLGSRKCLGRTDGKSLL